MKYTVEIESANNRSRIRSRVSKNEKLRTEVVGRDDESVTAAVTTCPRTQKTQLFIDFPNGETARLSGREARTLYRLLQKHYQYTERNW